MNENMKKGRKEARIGLKSEEEIVNLINSHTKFRNLIKESLKNLGFNFQKEIRADLNNMKTDIYIENNLKIGVSIKSSTKTSFHQLDRRRLERWKKELTMPNDIFMTLKEAIMRVARNSKDYFILPEDRDRIKKFFLTHVRNVISEIFTHGERDLKVLMINDKRKHKLYLFRMEEVVNFLTADAHNNINFSTKGIIRLGNFITVQRKGGDSSKITVPKTNWRHSGNQLQFKFSPLKFVDYIEKNNKIKYEIIEV